MNVWTIAGRIGRDAETRGTPSGQQVTNFSVAVDEYGKDERKTLWVSCAMWGERGAKLAQHLTKGKAVTVSGAAGVRTYEGNQGTRAELTLRVTEITLHGGSEQDSGERKPQSKTSGAGRTQKPAGRQQAPEDFDDDVPFLRI